MALAKERVSRPGLVLVVASVSLLTGCATRTIGARWAALRQIRDSIAFATDTDAQMAWVVNTPNADIYTVDVSFEALKDKAEREFLNQLPTSFVLSDEAVDRLRAAAARLIFESPDLEAPLKDAGLRVMEQAAPAP